VREAAARAKCQNNLKQIGLALHNHHVAVGNFPAWGQDFSTNPNPSNALGAQTKGHAALGFILPYVEQANISNLGRTDRSTIDPLNLPAPLGTCQAGAAILNIYLCPSATSPPADYAPYFQSVGVPAASLPKLLLGTTDYVPIRGYTDAFQSRCASSNPAGSSDAGALGPKSGKPTVLAITDGTSNTLMIVEDAGRQAYYVKGRLVTAAPATNVWYSAWGDYDHKVTVDGISPTDGTSAGCGIMNMNNNDEMYSFHSGGANILRADGSVGFLRDSTSAPIVAALVTKAGGEVIADY
jgi:prepilin-type processing-associated H-X9-DG protein